MSTIAERLSIFSVLGLGFKAIRSKIKPLLLISVLGFLLPLILLTATTWVIGIRGVRDLDNLLTNMGPDSSIISGILPFAGQWLTKNLLVELVLGSWIAISYLFAIRILLDYFVLRKSNLRETFKASVSLFFRKILFAALLAAPLLILSQALAFLGLFLIFMLMMLPILIQVRSDGVFRTFLSSISLTYVREMKLSRLEVAFLLMSIGGIFMLTFYGLEYFLTYLKHLDVYHDVPQFLIDPIPALAGLNSLTLVIEFLETIGITALLTVLAGTTVSAYAKMEQESMRRELAGRAD